MVECLKIMFLKGEYGCTICADVTLREGKLDAFGLHLVDDGLHTVSAVAALQELRRRSGPTVSAAPDSFSGTLLFQRAPLVRFEAHTVSARASVSVYGAYCVSGRLRRVRFAAPELGTLGEG